MRRNRKYTLLAAGLVAALTVAACGSDDGGSSSTGTESAGTEATAGTEASAETEAPPDTTETEVEGTTAEGAEDVETEGGQEDANTDGTGVEAEGDVDTEITEASGVGTPGGSIIIGLEAESTGLRPWEDNCSAPCYNMMVTIFDKLIESRSDGTYGPYLAEDIAPNADFTEWTLTLRPDVMFSNGVPLTAQTIVDMFAIQQTGSAAAGAIASSGLASVEATDDLTVVYKLNKSNSAFPASLERMPLGGVFEPAAAAADPDGFSTSPVGTGPFIVQSRDLDNSTVVVRNDNYWQTDAEGNALPYLDSIEFRPIPDEGTRLDSLQSGTVNVMETLRQGTIRDARDSLGDAYTLYEHQGNNVGGGMYNTAVAPFDDVRVRLGLTQMNNQDAVIEALGGTGISLPGTQWFSPDSPWWTQEAADAWPKFDYEAGQETLQQYIDDPARSDGKSPGDPIDVELSCPPDPTLIAAMQVLEQLWSQSGLVNVSLTNYDQQTHINNALGAPPDWLGTHKAHCWRWSSENDPSTFLNPEYSPPNEAVATANGLPPESFSATNFANYFNLDMYNKLQEAIATDDFETRKALYKDVMLEIAAQVPVWYSGHTATMLAADADIVGLNTWTLPDGSLGIGFPGSEGRWTQVWIQD